MSEQKLRGEKIETATILTWGDGNPILENHSRDFACTNNECVKQIPENQLDARTIGIKNVPFTDFAGLEYARMIECPDCLQVYWFHMSKDEARKVKSLKESQKT
ncbi:MAG: hypothetical protein HY981_02160 [Candidatus Magasanikbacteria bacterium]|nr:hypothetical protein [Candidatus Magasanikbacteria bacterium]